MAGKNHHYIPQFLQRGFSCQAAQGFAPKSKKDNKDAQIWLFKRESARIAHIRKEGAEKYFYGPENSHVDKTITYAESSYGKLVNILRAYTKDTIVEEENIPELFAHMIVRSKNIRQTMVDLGGSALDIFSQSLPDMEGMTDWLINHLQKNPDKIVNNLSDEQKEFLKKRIQNNPDFIKDSVKEKGIMEELFPQFRQAISTSQIDVNEIAKTAHIDALSESVEPQDRVEKFQKLNWFLSVRKPGSYILGDALVICRKMDGEYSSILSIDEEFQYVFLPVSSQHLLVGTIELPILDINLEDINRASARMSNEFFIASQNSKREVAYQKDLGSGYSASLDEKIVEMTTIANQYWIN
jgi:Protein of unknown function (DUF4238)